MLPKKNNSSSDERQKITVWQRIKPTVKKWVMFAINPKLLICFGIAWFITNGWSYLALGLGVYFDIDWLTALAGAYLGILWIPFTPEKILTLIISFALLKLLFPRDEKTLAILNEEARRLKDKRDERKRRKEDISSNTAKDKME